jgi:hypothetical protein
LSKIEREIDDDDSDGKDVLDDDHNTGVAFQGGFVRYDDCAMTATATAKTATRTKHAVAASSEECITPPASTKKVAVKKKSQDLTPSKRSNGVLLDKDKRSRSTKSNPQVLDLTASVSPKKPAGRKMTQKVLAPPPAATTVAKKRK